MFQYLHTVDADDGDSVFLYWNIDDDDFQYSHTRDTYGDSSAFTY